MGTATGVTVQWQMHRTRGARVIRRRMVASHCDCFVSRAHIYRWRAARTKAFVLYVIVAGCRRTPKTFHKHVHKRACCRLVHIT
jgi:hypothetical protein